MKTLIVCFVIFCSLMGLAIYLMETSGFPHNCLMQFGFLSMIFAGISLGWLLRDALS